MAKNLQVSVQGGGSPRWELYREDLKKVGVGALVALGGALATYAETAIPGIDFGQWQVLVVAVNSVLVNLLRKWVTDHRV